MNNKIAILISGQLRTFLHPQGPWNILTNLTNLPADVFFVTETDDFYYNGTQYFYKTDENVIKTYNWDVGRFGNNIDFIDFDSANDIITNKIQELFGKSLKLLKINKPLDYSSYPVFHKLKQNMGKGGVPEFLLSQHHKLNQGLIEIKKHEKQNEFQYDYIVRCRCDSMFYSKIDFNNYDFNNYDLFVPGREQNIVYDWFAIGNRWAMELYLSIFNNLGHTLSQEAYHSCGQNITLSSEHHIYRCVTDNQIRTTIAPTHHTIYRYDANQKPVKNEKYKIISFTVDNTPREIC